MLWYVDVGTTVHRFRDERDAILPFFYGQCAFETQRANPTDRVCRPTSNWLLFHSLPGPRMEPPPTSKEKGKVKCPYGKYASNKKGFVV